jgi:CRP-like cAMP-binding protein
MPEQRLNSSFTPPVLRGIWLTDGPTLTPIETLLFDMLEATVPRFSQRRAVIEELERPVKLLDVVLECLDLESVGADAASQYPLLLVTPHSEWNPWEAALLAPQGTCPIGLIVNTHDRGRVALVHKVVADFPAPLQDLVRRYVALSATITSHAQIVDVLKTGPDGARGLAQLLADARRRLQVLNPSVLLSRSGGVRVQLGSLSQTARNLLREGIRGEYVFILPPQLFEGKTNFGDIEFLVYLNFFVRQGVRTRILGTERQRRVLKRLLTLVIFGVFDPDTKEPLALEQLQKVYGVPDRETYEFLLTAYEMYAVREAPFSASPILGLDAYVDFVALEPDETVIHLDRQGTGDVGGSVHVSPSLAGGFDVRIVETNGQSISKRLEMPASRRMTVAVEDALRLPIQFATDRPRFGVTPLGTSHGFDPDGDLTSFVIWINGRGILVDPSPEALAYLDELGVSPVDVPYVFLTHVHADHDGGLLEKLLVGSRTTVIASDVVFRSFVEKAQLVTGHDFEREGLVHHLAANPGIPVRIDIGGELATLDTRWNFHPIPTNGFKVSVGGRTFGYSADTQYNAGLIRQLRDRGRLSGAQYDALMHFFWTPDGIPEVDLLYHEAGIPPIHTEKEQLQALPDAVKARTFLVHIADKHVPEGFMPPKPRVLGTHVLLPATEQSRNRVWLDTMRLVSYLYDIPSETLVKLLGWAKVREYADEEVIIRKGPVSKDEPLCFYIVADGQVAVKDGRRLIARLRKADTFGEWGISYQRGYRVADVVSVRACQCIQFSEAQYWWLVERHPVVQARIAKIRALMPRLQLAQVRLRLQAEADPLKGKSVIMHMTTGQLSGWAIFSAIETFQKGQAVVVEGEPANGCYVLLSGHLAVTVSGSPVGELGEGDLFGEIALLEGGTRQATITVVSPDAEVLFMSTQNFRRLLETMPSFSWGIREIAAYRKETSKI